MANRGLKDTFVDVEIQAKVQNTLPNGTISQSQIFVKRRLNFTNGVGSDQADRAIDIENVGTIKAGTSIVLDLSKLANINAGAGNGDDQVGMPWDAEELAAVFVANENKKGDLGALEISPATSNGFTEIGTHTKATGGALYGSGVLLKCQGGGVGYPIGPKNAQLLLAAVDGDVNYRLTLIARSESPDVPETTVAPSDPKSSASSSSSSKSSDSGSKSSS